MQQERSDMGNSHRVILDTNIIVASPALDVVCYMKLSI